MNKNCNINNQIEYINNNEMTFNILFNKEYQNYNINYLYLYINKFQKIYNEIFQNIFKKTDIYNQYNCLISFENLISKYLFIIKILINNQNFKNKGNNIFLLCLKENYKSIEYFYEKIINKLFIYEKNISNLKIYHKIIISLLKIIGNLLKFSNYFNKLSFTKKLLLLYLNILKTIHNYYKLKDLDEINKYNYNFCFCLFNVSLFCVINYLPLKISIELSNLVKFIYSKNYDDELSTNEKILLFKNIYNLGFYNYIYRKNEDAINNLMESKNKLLQLTSLFPQENLFQNKIYSIDAISKNSLFTLKPDEEYYKTSSKTIKKSDYLNNIYSNDNIFSKKNKNNFLYQFEKKIFLKEKILKNIELTIGEIELDNNNYVSAYKHIQIALNYLKKRLEKPNNFTLLNKKYKIKSSIISRNEDNFSIEKRKIEKLLSEIEKKYENNIHNINENSDEVNKNYNNIKNYESSKLIIKELEKFFIFLYSLNLYQIKILNDSQPEINNIKQRNDLPIFFSNNFKDCLTQNQRNLLNNLSNLALSRYNILKNPMGKIELKNFNFDYFNINDNLDNDKKYIKKSNSVDNINNNRKEDKNFKKLIDNENINQETKKYLIENYKYVIKILKKSSDEDIMNFINNPEILIKPINTFIKKNKENIYNKNYEEEDKNENKKENSKTSLEYYNINSHESNNIINNLELNTILEENKEYLINNNNFLLRTGDNFI